MDEAWYKKYCERVPQHSATANVDSVDKPKRSKYGNKRTELDGITFDSKREADRYSELTVLLKSGDILGVFRQHPFRLPGGVVYIADFVVLNRNGTFTVEDAKGVRTDVYKIKRKLMKECLGIEIAEV